MDIYYCGFNGFKQVPVGASSDTLTCLTLHTKSAQVRPHLNNFQSSYQQYDGSKPTFKKFVIFNFLIDVPIFCVLKLNVST